MNSENVIGVNIKSLGPFEGPRAPSYPNSRLLGYVSIGYIEPRTHDLGNWSPRGDT